MNLVKKIIYLFCNTCKPNTSSTVRYAFPLVFTVAAFLGAAVIVSNDKTFIHLESSVQSVKAGETFQINVFVSAYVPVNAIDLSLEFPKQQVQILGIDIGQSVITLWTQKPYVEGNKVIMRGGTFRRGFVGNHLIATINAKAIESGLAQFTTNNEVLLAGDGTGSQVQVTNTGKENAVLYVTNADGSLAQTPQNAIGVKGNTVLTILTDLDGDGKVTLADISRFMSAWSTRSSVFDFNADGVMSFSDFGIILADSFFH